MSVYRRTNAVTLRRENLGENDRRYVLFTERFGKLVATGRGTHKLLSKLSSSLEPIQFIQLTYVAGRTTNTIIAADITDSYQIIKAEAVTITQGIFIAEVIDNILETEQADQRIWQLLTDTLHELNEQRMVSPILGSYFVVRLLRQLGMGPDFQQQAVNGQRLQEKSYVFDLERGGLVSESTRQGIKLSTNVVKALRLFAQGDLETVRRLAVPLADASVLAQVAAQLLSQVTTETIQSLPTLQALTRHLQETV